MKQVIVNANKELPTSQRQTNIPDGYNRYKWHGIPLLMADMGFGWGFYRSGKLIRLFVALSISICAYAEQQPPPSCAFPVWSKDLVPHPGFVPRGRYWQDNEQSGITYLDNQRLLLHHITLDPGQLSSRESPDISSPFRLRTLMLDANNGKPVLTREWGTRAAGSAIVPNLGGVIVRTGDMLRQLSSDFDEQQRTPLRDPSPGDHDVLSDWKIQVSASRRSVLFNHYHVEYETHTNISQFQVRDGDTFQVTHSWEQVPALHDVAFSVSDSAIAYVQHESNRDQVVISQFGSHRWKSLWRRRGMGCYDLTALALLSENSFLYACKTFTFVSQGQTVLQERFDKGEQPVHAKISTDSSGRFAAVSLSKTKACGHEMTECLSKLRIVVYDLQQRKRVQSVSISPIPQYYYDFALSPDGANLAILNDSQVSVCPVQVPRIETQQADMLKP